ncbi:Transcription regulator lscL [Paramyrothecium foliicola]|nr:Transcription regulator lscL [Paramyrothecium foliicola]
MSASRNADAMNPSQGEFRSRVAPSEPLTTKVHAIGTKLGNDAAPEFHAESHPAGTAPPDRSFQPNITNEYPAQALHSEGNSRTAASDTLQGATSADVRKGYGLPNQGMTSQEQHGGKRKHDGAGLEGVRANAIDPFHERGLDRDHATGHRGVTGNTEDWKGAEERPNPFSRINRTGVSLCTCICPCTCWAFCNFRDYTSVCTRFKNEAYKTQLSPCSHWLWHMKRHVKCDETKPACINCLKWRGTCDGYSETTAHGSQSLARTSSASSTPQTLRSKDGLSVLTEPSVITIRFSSSDQRAYFDEWTALSLTFLSGGLDQTRLWTTTMPQLTLNEPTLRFAAMAIGALRKAYEIEGSSVDLSTSNTHYLNAITFYCEALRLQSKAKPTKAGLRTALLSSLLFICFEAQRGNMPAALKHVTHGFSMLNELAACTNSAPGLVSIAPAPPALVQEILDCYKPLELQSRSFMGSYKKPLPPTADRLSTKSSGPPRESDKSLPGASPTQSPSSQPGTPWQASTSSPNTQARGLPSPSSMASPNSSHEQTPPPSDRPRPPGIAPFTKASPYFRPKQTSITLLAELPRIFQSFDEAQGYWILVQRQMVQFLPMLTITIAQLALPKATSDAEVELKLASVKQNQRISKFIAESRYWLQRWVEAYEPYYHNVVSQAGKYRAPYLQAINLRIEYLILYIYTATPRFGGLISARGLTPQYREMNGLITILLASRPNCGFAMDSGWAWPLFVSSFACRDPEVRCEAVRILEKYPMRNALRDSRVLRAIALKNQDVEATNARDGTENEQWLRLRRREVMFEDFGASVIFRFMQKDPVTGEWLLVEEVASSRVEFDGRLRWTRQSISDSISILGGVC